MDKKNDNKNVQKINEEKNMNSSLHKEIIFNKIIPTFSKDIIFFSKYSNFAQKYKEEFKITPAAKLMHHNYIGGLLEHTFECLEFADVVLTKCNGKLNSDTVYAACILHDFGKIFEYIVNTETGLIEYNEDFRKDWRTHSQWGFTVCMSNGFKDVAKMIAAHHGRKDWGALIDLDEKDAEPFMYIIHHIDDLSAKFGKISITDID